jgi:hypothetical protein
VVWLKGPETPVMVTLVVPAVALGAAVSVNVLVPVAGSGVKIHGLALTQ